MAAMGRITTGPVLLRLALPLVGVALLCAGCGQSAGGAAAPKANVNVVLFLIDTLRADHTSLNGYAKPTTPTLAALAKEGVVFENAHAPAPWTLPSVPSIMTSTFQCEHGVTVDGEKINPELRTMAERFRTLGYYTSNYFVNDYAGPVNGMDRGFDVCLKHPRYVDGTHVANWFETRPAERPFFLYIHNIEPHNPHNADDTIAARFGAVRPNARQRVGRLLSAYRPLLRAGFSRDPGERLPLGAADTSAQQDEVLGKLHKVLEEHLTLYDATVYEADQRVASVVEQLKRNGVWDNTLFICLSDHGEEFAEHGAYLHSQSVYQELAHVPLLMRFPRGEFGGRRVKDVISLVDVLPTLFDYLGRRDVIGDARGESLMPLVRGQPRQAPPLIVTTVRMNSKKYYRPWAEQRGDVNVALRTPDGRYKCVYNVQLDTVELYDLTSDPTEQKNLAATTEHAPLAQLVRHYAGAWFNACKGASKGVSFQEMDEETRKSLEALGYLDGPGEEQSEEDLSP
jgi:arylsulfatase A-like enzyme